MKIASIFKSIFLTSIFLLTSCQKESHEINKERALAILKQIDREINYTPLVNAPKSYILYEELSSYEDGDKTVLNAKINREIDQNSHYSFVRIKGTYEGYDYVHENWTYISRDNNVTCNYYSYAEGGKIFNDRYRYESEKDVENWESVAKKDIEEMQRLYAQMAKNFYSYLYNEENIINEKYSSNGNGYLNASFVSEKNEYSCVFENYMYISGSSKEKETDSFYSSSVSWNNCDISMPSLDFYPLRENK